MIDPEKYARGVERGLIRYSAGSSGDMLRALTHPDNADALEPYSDHLVRQVAADALEDDDRHHEAALLRGHHPLRVANGEVHVDIPRYIDRLNDDGHLTGTRAYSKHYRHVAAEAMRLEGRHGEGHLLDHVTLPLTTEGDTDDTLRVVPNLPDHYEGYPVVHTIDGDIHCRRCANSYLRDNPERAKHLRTEPYWEGPPVECDGCGHEIESAYGDPHAEDDDHRRG